MPEIKIIKKYPNRRLYDTNESRYTSLEAIKLLIQEGIRLKILDARTEQDLTHQTLLQILSEEEGKGSPILTAELLQLLIRFYGNPLQSMIGHYLEQSLFFLLDQQHSLKEALSKWLAHNPLASIKGFTEKKLHAWNIFQTKNKKK